MNKLVRQRHFGIDLLRVISMCSVIYLHTIPAFTMRLDFFLTKAWFVFEPFSAFSRAALALFFMISGYLVVGKKRTIRENMRITYKRIIIPFVCFSILTSLFFLWKTKQSISQAINPSYVFKDVLKFPDNWLWFLRTLLFLYLLNPLWQVIFANTKNKAVARYTVYFFLIFTCFAVIIKHLTGSLLFFNAYTTWVGYIFCYLYGALVKNNWDYKRGRVIYIAIFVLGLLAEMVGDYLVLVFRRNGVTIPFAGYFIDYIALPPLLMAIGAFNIGVNIPQPKIISKKISLLVQKNVATLATLSFGIYLTHKFFSEYITDVLGWNIDSLHVSIYLYNITFFVATLMVSIIVTFFILRIPKLKVIIGE